MGPFIAAWLVGEGIIVYRSVKVNKAPPSPGGLALSSGLFIMLALLAEARSARTLAITLAWGFDIAALMNLWGTGGPKATATGDKHWPPPLASDTQIFPSTAAKPGAQAPSSTGNATPNVRLV
jgi:hypothetical protein